MPEAGGQFATKRNAVQGGHVRSNKALSVAAIP